MLYTGRLYCRPSDILHTAFSSKPNVVLDRGISGLVLYPFMHLFLSLSLSLLLDFFNSRFLGASFTARKDEITCTSGVCGERGSNSNLIHSLSSRTQRERILPCVGHNRSVGKHDAPIFHCSVTGALYKLLFLYFCALFQLLNRIQNLP